MIMLLWQIQIELILVSNIEMNLKRDCVKVIISKGELINDVVVLCNNRFDM